MLLYALLGILFLVPIPTFATTFYTATTGSDSLNDCTEAQDINTPKRTITAGIGCITAAGGTGHTLYIRGGTYNETIQPGDFHIPSGTDWNNVITISGYGNETVSIPAINMQGNLDGSTPQYIVFANMSITRGVGLVGTVHHLRFSNMDISSATVTDPGSFSGMSIGGFSHDHEILNSRIHDCPVAHFDPPCSPCSYGNYGVYNSGYNVLFDGNHIYNNAGYGIHQHWSGHDTVSNNIYRNNHFYGNGYSDGQRSLNDSLSAIILDSGSGNQFYNNLVYNNRNGIIASKYDNIQIYNNTVYNNNLNPSGGDTSNTNIGINIAEPVTNSFVQNNIVFGNRVDFSVTNVPSNLTMDHNCPANSTIRNGNCSTNPLFEDAGNANFKLLPGSPMIDAGTPIGVVPKDIDGADRGQGSGYDMGAYEFNAGGPPPNPTPTGNPIYVRKTAGSPSNSCAQAEDPAHAKQTIADACQCMTTPGKVMFIEGNGNVYQEEIDTQTCLLTGGNGPSYANATRIEGYGTPYPTIQSPVSNNDITLYIRTANDKFLIFKNLVIDAASRAGNALIITTPAHHIRFEGVEIKGASPNANVFMYGANNVDMVSTTITTGGGNGLELAGPMDSFLCAMCTIKSHGGKGIHVFPGVKTNISFMQTEIHSNVIDGIDTLDTTNLVVQNSIIRSNGGKGIRLQSTDVAAKLFNNTIYANSGNGVQCDSGATAQMTNVLSYANGTNLVDNCSLSQTTNLTGTLDPMFVAAPTDLRLANGSIGIDQGTNLPAITTDFAGLARRQGQQDIGAHERAQGTPPVPPGPGVLRVSTTNPRYMENPSGEIVYLTGAYSWNFASTMPDAELTEYLAYVVAHGYNLLRVPSQDYTGEAQSTDYFDILASRIGQAAAAGLYVQVSIFPFTDAPFNSQVFNEAYARDLVEAVGSYPNVIYEIGNELDTQSLDGGTVGAFAASMVTAINNEQSIQGFTPRRMVGISDFKADNTFNTNAATVSFLLGSQADFVGIGFSQRTFQPCWVNPDYAGVKVSIPDTDHISPYQCDHKWAWRIFLTGGNPILLDGNAFTANFSVPDNPADTFGANATYDARSRMGDTRSFAIRMRLDMVVPHPELSTTGYALAWPGNQYLVYQPGTGSFNVTLTAGDYTVEWFNPVEHTTTTTTLTASGGAQSFSTPLNAGHDAVLFLKIGTPLPPAPDLTVLTPSKRGRSMLFDLMERKSTYESR
jgi:parallel beta helix pectate lyase-like protein